MVAINKTVSSSKVSSSYLPRRAGATKLDMELKPSYLSVAHFMTISRLNAVSVVTGS